MPREPRWRRRKEARPAEIIAAALETFGEQGFAGAKIDDIARKAGVSKGAVYLYFQTKEDLFKAAVGQVIAPNFTALRELVEAYQGPFAELIRTLLPQFAQAASGPRIGSMARMVIGESRTFPDLARIWYEQLVSHAVGMLSTAISRAQTRGEIRAGDPGAYALSLMGPLVAGLVWREVFVPVGAEPIDLGDLARQHVEAVLTGMLEPAR